MCVIRTLVLITISVFVMLAHANSQTKPKEESISIITYSVKDLISKNDGIDNIAKIIMTSVNPACWNVEGSSSLQETDIDKLEIRTTKAQHEQIKDLLEALRRIKRTAINIRVSLCETDRIFFEKEIIPNLDRVAREQARSSPSPIDAILAERIYKRSKNVRSYIKKTLNGESVVLFSRRRAFTYVGLPDKGNVPEPILKFGFEGELVEALVSVTADRRKVNMQIMEHKTRLVGTNKQSINAPKTDKIIEISFPKLSKTKLLTPIQVDDQGVIILPHLYLPLDKKNNNRIWLILFEPNVIVEGE